MQHCQHPYRVGCEDIAAIPLKSCNQCSHYRGGYCYGFGTAKKVFSTAEAIFCEEHTPLGQVKIGPLGALAGQLVDYQIPTGIISTIKLADLAVTSAKLADASVTLLKIANDVITDAKIAAGAAIAESKLALSYPTHDNVLDHAEAHTLASHSTKAHAELTDVLANQHHAQSHTLASHTTKAHTELTDVLASQHHVRYADSEAVAAVEAEALLNVGDVEVDGDVYPKTTDVEYIGMTSKVFNRGYFGYGLYFGIGQDTNLYRDAANSLKTDDVFNAGGGLKVKNVVIDFSVIYDLLSYGSGNAAWIPCAYEGDDILANDLMTSSAQYIAGGSVDGYKTFMLPKPCLKGTQKLYISGIRWYQSAADADDYVDYYLIRAMDSDGDMNTIKDSTVNETTTGEKPSSGITFAAVDASANIAVKIMLRFFNTTAGQLKINYLALKCHYA